MWEKIIQMREFLSCHTIQVKLRHIKKTFKYSKKLILLCSLPFPLCYRKNARLKNTQDFEIKMWKKGSIMSLSLFLNLISQDSLTPMEIRRFYTNPTTKEMSTTTEECSMLVLFGISLRFLFFLYSFSIWCWIFVKKKKQQSYSLQGTADKIVGWLSQKIVFLLCALSFTLKKIRERKQIKTLFCLLHCSLPFSTFTYKKHSKNLSLNF